MEIPRIVVGNPELLIVEVEETAEVEVEPKVAASLALLKDERGILLLPIPPVPVSVV